MTKEIVYCDRCHKAIEEVDGYIVQFHRATLYGTLENKDKHYCELCAAAILEERGFFRAPVEV